MFRKISGSPCCSVAEPAVSNRSCRTASIRRSVWESLTRSSEPVTSITVMPSSWVSFSPIFSRGLTCSITSAVLYSERNCSASTSFSSRP